MKNNTGPVRLLSAVVLFVITAFSLYASDSPADILRAAETAFRKASEEPHEDYSEALFLEAAALYENLIHAGIVNGEVHYNTANSWLKGGRTGKAVVHYLRALRYRPSDRQLHANLEYARSRQKNSFTRRPSADIVSAIMIPVRYIPFGLQIALFFLSFAVFWFQCIRRLLRRDSKPRILLPALVILVSAGMIASAFAEHIFVRGVVTASSTVGRNGDARGYEATFSQPLYEGLEFRIKEHRAGWYLAVLPSGDLTWLESADCELVNN